MIGPTVDGNIMTVGYKYERHIVFIFYLCPKEYSSSAYHTFKSSNSHQNRARSSRTRCKITRGEQRPDGLIAVLTKHQPRVVTSARDWQGLREPAEVAEVWGALHV